MTKKFILMFLLGLQGVIALAGVTHADTEEPGRLNPSAFGAKGDGVHDDTDALQTALDSLDRMGGGAVYLGNGTYMVSSVRLGKKTSLIGCGNGATLIKQIEGTEADCVIVPAKSAALRISNLSIIGNDVNNGLMIERSQGGGENHPYLYSKDIKDGIPQPYKWMTLDDICIYHFSIALNIEPHGFNINICNSTFSHSDIGVVLKCTDSSMYNCYITNNKKDGLYIISSNNKIHNVKSIFNGIGDPINSAGIKVIGSNCQIMNCETQDNYCKGFLIGGQYNLLTNCLSNTDGYSKIPYGYDPSILACGFRIEGLFNTFSNCVVSNYTDRFGTISHSPVIVDETISYYYPNIFDCIKVLIAKDRRIFREPFRNVQTLCSKNQVDFLNVNDIDGERYFIPIQKKENTIKEICVHTSSLQMLVDFRSMGENGNIMGVNGDNDLRVSINHSTITINWQGKMEAELALDNDVVLNKDDLRLIISFYQYKKKRYISMLIYEKTVDRGWIKKEVRQETTIPATRLNNVIVKIGDGTVPVKRLAITQSPIPESVFLPSSNTNCIYDSAVVYVDADSSI